MTMQDPSARLSHDAIRGRRRLLLPAGLRLRLRALRLRLRRRRGPEVRLRERTRRQLAAMDRALVTEAPGLASMFVMFNQYRLLAAELAGVALVLVAIATVIWRYLRRRKRMRLMRK